MAAELVELQVELALWERRWDEIWPNGEERQQVAHRANQGS